MKTAILLAVLLAASSVLAGCLSFDDDSDSDDATDGILDPSLREPLSTKIYDILGHFEHKFTGSQGTQLYVDYYLPDIPADDPETPDGKVPVILVFTPYQSAHPEDIDPALAEAAGQNMTSAAYNTWLVEYFVPRGYAVAFADVRGNHQAGGCIDQTGPAQWQDGYDYVEWLGTQDWSNGNVGMYGASYDAETQFTTAMMAPPHLKTIVPVASVSNQYEWSFYQGVPYTLQPFIGMFSYFTGSAAPSHDPMDATVYHEKLLCQPEQFAAGTDFSGDMTQFWKERDYRPMAGDIEASVLHVHGLADWNVRPIHIDPLFNEITSEKRGIFGLWPHAYPDRADWQDLLTAWYDHYLKGKQNGILDILPPVLIEDSTGAFHGIGSFPPEEQEWLELELSADGSLVVPGNATEGDLVVHDYRRQGPLGLPVVIEDEDTGVQEDATARAGETQAQIVGHPTELVFEWTTTEELHLVGRPEVAFTATTDQESTHWAVRIEVEGDPDCEYTYNRTGAEPRELTQDVCTNTGYQDTRHLEGLDKPSTLTPGEPYDITVQMYPQYDVVPAGKTVRLVVSNTDGEVQQDDTGAMSTLHLGGDTPALLRLPLSPDRIALPHDELPEIYPGYLG